MPFYRITTKGEEKPRLIKAPSAQAAIRFCVADRFKAETVNSVEEAVDLYEAGIKAEDATAEPQAEPEAQEQGQGEGQTGEEGKPPKPPKADA